MYSLIVLCALATISANYTFGSGEFQLRSNFEESCVGRSLDLLGGLAMLAGLVWGFLVEPWLMVVIDALIGVVAGAVLFAVLRVVGMRGLWSLLSGLGLVVVAVLMYGSYWHWFNLPLMTRRAF